MQISRLNLNSIVRLLEDVAAAMSGAENVEDLVALAPSLCGATIGKILCEEVGILGQRKG